MPGIGSNPPNSEPPGARGGRRGYSKGQSGFEDTFIGFLFGGGDLDLPKFHSYVATKLLLQPPHEENKQQ